MILCSHAYSTLEGLSVLRFLHYGASLFSDLADCITLKQWKLCCMGWPRSPSKKDLLSSCWGMQSLYGLQLSVHSGIIWVALPKITPLPWWFKGMIVLPHVGPAPSFFLMLLIIVLLSSPVAYWTPSDLGGLSSGVTWFCLFILFKGFSWEESWSVLLFPSPVDPSSVDHSLVVAKGLA